MSLRLYLILALAMVSVSTTSLVIRYVAFVPALVLAFWRMLTASGMLWGYSAVLPAQELTLKNRTRIVFAGFFLGLHFAFFFLSVRHTSIANATLLANTGPFFTVLIALILKQHISRETYLGLGIAALGLVVVQGSSFRLATDTIYGNSLAILSGLCIALTYVFASKIRQNTDNTIYGRTLFFIAAITIGLIALANGDGLLSFKKEHVFWLLFLGFVPSILGHNMLNYSLKYLSPTAVASVPLGEPILASIFGYILFKESIPLGAYLGGPIILAGIYIILRGQKTDST